MNIGFDENTAVEEYIIDIRDKNDVIKHRYALNSKDIEKNALMSEHYIQLEEFSLDSLVKFVRTDYIIWEGEKYMIKEDYIPDQVNKFNYKYTLRFDHWTTFLQDDTFYYTNQNLEEADWSLMSNAATHFQLIADNANRYFGVNTFNVGTIEFAEMKLLQFSKVSIWDAATQIADAYKAEWYLTGTTFHLVNKFSYGSEVDFESEISVEKMDRSEGENSEKYTRVLAFGSVRSLSDNYRETTSGEAVDAIYQKRLRIPASKGKFIDAKPNMSPEEIKSAVVIFEEIYPKRIGTMSSITTVEYTDTNSDTGVVTKWNAYRYKDTGLQFKEEYLLPGIELRVVFQSGNLNGTDYAVKFNPLGKAETDPDSQLFEIIRNEDYGKALPNDILKPQNGDTYILYGFNIQLVSDQYVPAGEQELFDTATEWLADNNKDKSVFECPTMIEYFEANEMDLEIGQKVKLMHGQFESGFRSSRIQGYEKHLLNKYQATYTVGDNAAYSWPKEVEESIKELQIAGITYQATGSNGVYLIKQFDNTPASDFNAYSAKASDAKYLDKQTGGTVQGDTTFQKKVKAKEVISDQFGNETFMPGMAGNGFRFWVENGLSFGQLDYLTITREMLISVLTVAEVKSVDGGIIVSAANMVCNKVEDLTSGYKCSFDNDNGNIPNKFAVGDQAICRRFNGANVKYYWRLVTEIGANYILLSKTDKDGSGIPSAKDNIVQFGNRTNTQRQFAVYTVGYGDAGTYYYYGVDSYDLTGKAKTYFDKTGARIDGESIIFSSSGKSATTVINESKQDAISTAATDATNKVNAIQVGGRNLITRTNQGTYGWYRTALNGTHSIIEIEALGVRAMKATTSVASTGYNVITKVLNHALLKNNTQYVISFDVYCDYDTSASLSLKEGNGINPLTPNYPFSIVRDTWTHIEQIINTNSTPISNQVLYISGFNTIGGVTLANLKLEEGNKATSWTAAPEDMKSEIDAANTAAQNAATAASNAQTSANTANSLLADIANDNLLIPSEKQDVLKEWQIIQGEYPTVVAQATTYSVSSSDYTTKYNALNTYITPLLSSMTTNSTIVATTFRSNFKAYYDAKISLLKLVTDKAKSIADQAQSSADTANAGLLTKVAYSEYNTQIQAINTEISLRAKQSDFNALGNRVTQAEGNISVQAGQISSVVTQVNTAQSTADSKTTIYYQDMQPSSPKVGDIWQMQTYTNINGIVETDTSKNVCRIEKRWNGTTWVQINVNVSGSYVTQTNDSITSLVTKTGINGLGVGETLKSLIDQTPTQIQLAVSAIKIGARNLLPNTNKGVTGWWYTIQNGSVSLAAEPILGVSAVKITTSVVSSGYHVLYKQLGTARQYIVTGRQYTLSMDIYCDFNAIAGLSLMQSSGTNSLISFSQVSISANTWIHVERTGVATSNTETNQILYITGFNQVGSVIFANVKLEEGNKATPWTPAVEDTQAEISAAQAAASNAATAASNADTKATAANNLLTDIANDNKLDPSEKQNTKKEWDIIVSEYSKNISQANSFSVSTTAYTTAYNALNSYITPLLTNLTATSDIVGTTFRSTFKAYYDARTDLLNAVSTKAKAIADSKTTMDEVASSLTIEKNVIKLSSKNIILDGTTMAEAIQANELNVGNGNFKVGTDGKISAKGAELDGRLRLLWNGSSSSEADTLSVVDQSQTPEKTKVLITPMNITSISDIAGNQVDYPLVSGGAAASDSTTNGQKTWTSQTFTLASGKRYDIVIPALVIIGETSTTEDRTTTYSNYRLYLDNTTTGSSQTVASGSTNKTIENAQWNSSYVATGRQAGTYRLRIVIDAKTDAFGNSAASYSIPANAKFTVRPINDAIEIGGNGIMGAFTNTRYFHITTDGFYVRMGSYGFRITEANGIQKSANMGVPSPTWTNI